MKSVPAAVSSPIKLSSSTYSIITFLEHVLLQSPILGILMQFINKYTFMLLPLLDIFPQINF